MAAISPNLVAAAPTVEGVAAALAAAAAGAGDAERRARGSAVSWSRSWDASFDDALVERVVGLLGAVTAPARRAVERVRAPESGAVAGGAAEDEPSEVVVGVRRGHPPHDRDRVGALLAGHERCDDDDAVPRVATAVERLRRQAVDVRGRPLGDVVQERLAPVVVAQLLDGDDRGHGGERDEQQAGEHGRGRYRPADDGRSITVHDPVVRR